jgi:hypothetical protein
MSKAATEADKNADRPDRPKPTMCERVCYEPVEAHGATDIGYTEDQTTRSHCEAKDREAKSQGAIVPGEDGADNAKRRFAAIHQRRKETEQVFAANRKGSSIVRKK